MNRIQEIEERLKMWHPALRTQIHYDAEWLLDELKKRDGEWTKTPPTNQGWYWAIPRFPEDAFPVMISIWMDDGIFYYDDRSSADAYRAFYGPIPEPPPEATE